MNRCLKLSESNKLFILPNDQKLFQKLSQKIWLLKSLFGRYKKNPSKIKFCCFCLFNQLDLWVLFDLCSVSDELDLVFVPVGRNRSKQNAERTPCVDVFNTIHMWIRQNLHKIGRFYLIWKDFSLFCVSKTCCSQNSR